MSRVSMRDAPTHAPAHAPAPGSAARGLPRFATAPVLTAVIAQLAVLAAVSNLYGYHRDELYFRMLPAAWGYVDQPPFTPALARFFSDVVADEAWAIRIPAMAFAAASVIVAALIAREVGGGPLAQGLAAWGTAFGAFTLIFGHVLLTASLDLLVWPAVVLAVMRAVLRERPQWWLAAGLLVGLSMYNKLLIALLLVSLAVGIVAVGPRRVLTTVWPYAAAVLALLVGLPNLVYQWANGFPQAAMGAALAENNADEVRILMWPLLLVLLGPLLVPTWVAGIVTLLRRPQWRPIRFLAVAFPVLLLLTFAGGSQFYYPLGLLVCLSAIGCVPVARFAAASGGRRALAVGAVAANGLISAVIALPLVQASVLGATPIPAVNQATADQVGWPVYVDQIEAAVAEAGVQGANAVIFATNYGQAGAIDRYGADTLPPVVSGHNALADVTRPGQDVTTVVVVGHQLRHLELEFERCEVVGTLDNGLGVDNEEQGSPIGICRNPHEPWSTLWPELRHYD